MELSVVVPFTRLWMVNEFLEMFDKIDFGDRTKVSVLFYNDTDDEGLKLRLSAYAFDHKGEFGRIKVYTSGLPKLDEWGDNAHITQRRLRIINMRKRCAELLGGTEFTFFLEDDTLVNPDVLQRLLELAKPPDVGLVSGVEMNRHAYPCLGVWKIEPIEDPTIVRTVPYRKDGIEPVDAAGMYCFVTRTNLYKEAFFRYEAECLGPDVCFGWDLRRAGYKVLVDWEVQCAHRIQGRTFYPGPEAREMVWARMGTEWLLQN